MRLGLHTAAGVAAATLVHTAGARVLGAGQDHPQWARTNYRARRVSLAGGVHTGLGLTALGLPVALVSPRAGIAQLAAAGAGFTLGYFDDMRGRGDSHKGLRGHLGALARGQVTTGAAKILGIGAGAGVAAAVLPRPRGWPGKVQWAVDSALIAGTANLANLLDLRPGRLLKVAVAALGPYALCARDVRARQLAAGAVTLCALQLPADLAETHMLGDTGANAIGATWGLVAVLASRPGTRAAQLGLVVALILASERVSFSRVIDSTPLLAHLDRWGRAD